tara:strand:+ start:488 stop:1153 length:666 start_codon:yes stop_codon:yes gene_type:complete
MTKKDVIKLLKRRLKDEEGRVGIELSTDGDSGRHASIYSSFTYDYDAYDGNGDPFIYIKTEDGKRIMFCEITESASGYTVSELQQSWGMPTQLIPLMEEIYKSIDLKNLELTDEEVILSKGYFAEYPLFVKKQVSQEEDLQRYRNLSLDNPFYSSIINEYDLECLKIYLILKKSTKEMQDLFMNYASELYEQMWNSDEIEGAHDIHRVSKSDVIKMVEAML